MIKSLKKKQGGFTLIELMVVIVIIGILVAIALPNFIGAQDRAKISSVKANMHTLQTIAETYAVDWGGVYAVNTSAMQTEGKSAGREYWKDFNNPFSGRKGSGSSYTDITTVPTAVASGSAGLTLYNPMTNGTNPVTRYFIYGLDKQGLPVQDKGQQFVLTNS